MKQFEVTFTISKLVEAETENLAVAKAAAMVDNQLLNSDSPTNDMGFEVKEMEEKS